MDRPIKSCEPVKHGLYITSLNSIIRVTDIMRDSAMVLTVVYQNMQTGLEMTAVLNKPHPSTMLRVPEYQLWHHPFTIGRGEGVPDEVRPAFTRIDDRDIAEALEAHFAKKQSDEHGES